MPIYEYRLGGRKGCSFCSNGFEMLQKLSESPLQSCPRCQAAVRRVISAPNLGAAANQLDPSNLERHGFTQYRKSGEGEYVKTAGKGPEVLQRDED